MNRTLHKQFKYCFIICLMLAAFLPAKAQFVTIPDTAFVSWLNSNGFAGCMNGNQLDTTCSTVLDTTVISCSAVRIKDLTGIQYFKGLDSLNLNLSVLDTIPALPPYLTYFYIYGSAVSSLPALPATLVYMDCYYNNFPYLPVLPPALINLECPYNHLVSLPALPSGLLYLNCGNNELTSLPALPASLLDMECYWNNLTALPVLPSGMKSIYTDGNPITALPALPDSLTWLSCYSNQLTTLPSLPPKLTYLNCNTNHLISLPAFPAPLQSVYSENNLLTALPDFDADLLYLDCSTNLLTALPALDAKLLTLACYKNMLTSLPALPDSLGSLICNNNLLTGLPLLPSYMEVLECGSNQLTTIPDLPPLLTNFYCDTNINLTCLPELKKVTNLSFTATGITCLPDYGQVTRSNPPLSTVPLCGIFNPNGCPVFWSISGRTYYDANHNCIFDSTDAGQNYVKVFLYNDSRTVQEQVYTGGEGFYSFLEPFGDYFMTVDTSNLPFALECPANGFENAYLYVYDSLSYNNDFAFKCRTSGFDIGVQSLIYMNGVPRPGGAFELNMIAGDMSQLYGARCASGISGQVRLIINGPLIYEGPVAGALTPVVNGDTLTWNIADFGAINDYTAFNGLFKVNSLAQIGTSICFSVNVTPLAGDNNHLNNYGIYCFDVENSFDPNEKEVYPTSVDSAGQWLTYTVRFQNTGTAPALNIIVNDTLSSNLDPTTFQLLTFSAPNLTQLFGNVVVFNFPNINLPDSLTSDSASRGYVQYRIKTISNLQQGAVIQNAASVYFDLNPPVVTNTVTVEQTDSVVCINSSSINQTVCSGDTFYMWNNPYYSTGAYTDTFMNVAGCDSIVTLYLTVNNSGETIFSYTACDSFVFNNQTITQSGNYYDTLQTVSGCDSIVTLYLTINYSYGTTINNTVCGGFVFDNHTITQSGTYYDSLQTINGCDSIITLNLTVNTSYDTVISDTVCGSIVFNNQTITQSGTYADTLQSSGGCDSIITLQLTVNTPDTLILSDALCAGDTAYMWGNAYDTTGNYIMTYTNVNGCDSLVILSVVVSPATYDTLSATICAGGIYLVGAGQIIHTQPGNYTDTITNTNGCDSIVSLILTVSPAVYDTTSASICSGDTFYVANTAYTLQGNYNDTLQSIAGCDSIVSLALTVNPAPVVTFNPDSSIGLGRYWCTNIYPVIILKGGNPPGGVYSGGGVSNDTLSIYLFQMQSMGSGLDTIFYSYADTDGCSAMAFDTTIVTVCSGIEQIDVNNDISIYPNPANSILYIKTEGLHPQTITIYDVNGQAVITQPFTPELDIQNLSAGVYLLEVNSVEGMARKRWVKSSE